jgi:hypothetical protein
MGFFGGGSSVNLASPPAIGSTTPNTGAFTTLSASGSASIGTTADYQCLNIVQATSNPSNLPFISLTNHGPATIYAKGGYFTFNSQNSGIHIVGNTASVRLGTTEGAASDVVILRENATGVLAQRAGTNAQTFRLYNTFTDASNYERGFFRWSSNVLEIGAEAAGTGTQRTIDIKIGTTTALSFNASAQASFSSRVTASAGFSTGGAFLFVDTISNGFRFTDGSGSTIASGGLFLYNAYTNTTNNERGFFRWASNVLEIGTSAAGTGTLRGLKIGTATTSLIGFYGVTPVDQPATVTDPTGGLTIDAEARTAINAIIDRLQELGLIA